MITTFRRLLIRFGKALPFIICAIVFVSYIESLIALCSHDYLAYNDCVVLNTPLSFWIADKFEYDALTILAATILSIAIESCLWNRLAICYLFIQLLEKSYFITVELYPEQVAAIITINMLACAWLCFKGLKIMFR